MMRAKPFLRWVCCLMAWAAIVAGANASAAAPTLPSAFLSYDYGNYPTSVALGDLNGDGKLDLALTSNDGRVSILLGQGDGTLSTETDFAAGGTPCAVAIGDLNGDGKLDLVVANAGSGTVSVLLGHGNGSFDAQVAYAVNGAPQSVALADLNRDGHVDVAVASGVSDAVSILLGNGDGTLSPPRDFVSGTFPHSVAVADLNRDGIPDLAVANAGSNSVAILLGAGDGSFGSASHYGTGAGPVCVVTEDLSGDGIPDLAVADSSANTVSILLGHGDGTFAARTDFDAGGQPVFLADGDLNGDGHPDLVVADEFFYPYVGISVSVLLGTGSGGFGSRVPYSAGTKPCSVAIGDLNGDGSRDLAVVNLYSHTISVLLGNGDGTFGRTRVIGAGDGGYPVKVADLNGDGTPDLIVAEYGAVQVLIGNGDGTFATAMSFDGTNAPTGLAIGDLNGDGRPDIVVVQDAGSTISVLLNAGGGVFQPKVDYAVGVNPFEVALGDLNGDGALDVVATNTNSNTVSVLLGRGDGTLSSDMEYDAGINPEGVALGDLNGDGKLDVVVGDVGITGISVLLGHGDGTLGPRSSTSLNRIADRYIAIGDMNGDGKADLAVSSSSALVSLFIGNGDGTFRPRYDYGVSGYPQGIQIGDLDGDGKLDILTADYNKNTISVIQGNGDGTLGAKVDYGTGAFPASVAMADLNHDGRPDVVVSDLGVDAQGNLCELLNTGSWPALTMQPVGQTVCSPQNLSLTALASGTGVSYRWRKDGTPLSDGVAVSGATTSHLSVQAVFPSDAGRYDVVASNGAGSATSDAAVVTVCQNPVFTLVPADRSAVLGTSATFAVALSASCTTLSLQWLHDGVPVVDDGRITGSTTATLALASLQAGDAGVYSLAASNGCATVTSPSAQLTVTTCPAAPTITAQPADVFVANGSPASFSVAADGCVAPTYQWLKNKAPVPGGTASTLSIASVTDADAGFYQAVVTAGGLSALSAVAVLNVPGPVFVTASHRYIGAACTPGIEVFWTLNAVADVRVDYEFTSSSTFTGPLTHSAQVPSAAAGIFDITPSPWSPFICYQITATDAALRSTSTPRRMATLSVPIFSLNNVVPSLVTYPFAFTLVSSGDAIGLGVQVANGNCTSLGTRISLDQAKLGPAAPAGSPLPAPIADQIAAGATVRMPADLKFLRSQVGVAPGKNATFKGRIAIASTPAQYRAFSVTVRIPQ